MVSGEDVFGSQFFHVGIGNWSYNWSSWVCSFEWDLQSKPLARIKSGWRVVYLQHTLKRQIKSIQSQLPTI